ncbi:MAG: 2Fe-2S iron-sulfur cluster-binding protein [Pseudomonadota bacterium]
MPKITYIDMDKTVHECQVDDGHTVMEGAILNNVPGILGICGGSCACSTCHAYIDDAWADKIGPPDDIEDSTLELALERKPNSRLTCQIKVDDSMDGLVVHIANNE